jgi:hypothetical protein
MKSLFYILTSAALLVVGWPQPVFGTEVEEPPGEVATTWPPVVVGAVNPGYTTVDGLKNSHDFVELYRVDEATVELAGVEVRYNGKTIAEFTEGEVLEGERLLLRYSGSPEATEADLTYTANLSMSKGLIELVAGGEVWDAVCWGSEGCYDHFDKAATRAKTLRRCMAEGILAQCEDGRWLMYDGAYEPQFGGLAKLVPPPEPMATGPVAGATCGTLRFNEILTYYTEAQSEQFVELYNPGNSVAVMDGCALGYKNKTYMLSGTVAAGGYFVYQSAELKLTKDPSSENVLTLIYPSGDIFTSLKYPHGQKASTSYAYFGIESGEEVWLRTYAPTPGEANIWQEFRSCAEDKIINIATGNCVKVPVLAAAVPCKAGYERNLDTGRCRKIATTTGLAPCAEGWERNPETNRCRKIRENNGAAYAPTPTTFSDQKIFIATGALIATVALGGVYVIWQFRHELGAWLKRPFKRKLQEDKMVQ